jgi:lysine 2,3-aminomutase
LNKKTIRTPAELAAAGIISPEALPAISAVAEKYAIAISPQLVDLLQNPGVSQQFVPSALELNNTEHDLADPIGDKPYSPVKGIVHRYPDRCLLQPVNLCPVYCRFCFRRETIGPGNAALSETELQACYEYIKSQQGIWEVILSGGDPLILKPKKLAAIINNLDQIKHVEIIRIHTRVPVVDSARVSLEMLEVLKQRKPIYVILHINHPAEFSPAAIAAIEQLADNGIPLLGQTVLFTSSRSSCWYWPFPYAYSAGAGFSCCFARCLFGLMPAAICVRYSWWRRQIANWAKLFNQTSLRL